MAQRISEQFQGLVFLALSIIANFFICEPMRCHINLGRVTVTADIVQNLRCHCSGGALAAHQLRTQAGHKMPSLALKSVTLKRLLFKVTHWLFWLFWGGPIDAHWLFWGGPIDAHWLFWGGPIDAHWLF
jgi:hypothetical protein